MQRMPSSERVRYAASAVGGARPFCGGGANRPGRTNISPCYNEARDLLAVSLLKSLAAQDWRVAVVRVKRKAPSSPRHQYILSPAVPLFPINGTPRFQPVTSLQLGPIDSASSVQLSHHPHVLKDVDRRHGKGRDGARREGRVGRRRRPGALCRRHRRVRSHHRGSAA